MKPPASLPALRTFGLCKNYGSFQALDHISIQVEKGEVYGFLGPNGAGKTTTIGIMLGLLYPTSGKVEIFGEKVIPNHNRVLQHVGAMFGSSGFYPFLTGKENLQLLARLQKQTGDKRVDSVLEQVDLTDAAKLKVQGFSQGMKQRLSLASALLHKPDLFILDEPTNGMDPANVREFRNLMRLLAKSGVAIFLSSHLLHEIEQICDRVAVLQNGKIIAQGPVNTLLDNQDVVRVRVFSTDQALLVLKSYREIKSLKSIGSDIEVTGIPAENIIEILAAHKIYPTEVTNLRSDLESTFLHLTSDQPTKERKEI